MEYKKNEYVPEVIPGMQDINETIKKDIPKNPWDGAVVVGNMHEKERKEKQRQEEIATIIQKRDAPIKKTH